MCLVSFFTCYYLQWKYGYIILYSLYKEAYRIVNGITTTKNQNGIKYINYRKINI